MTPLDTSILGLPLHPLVVHLVVVALPAGALATLAAVVSPWVRTRYATLSVAVLSVGALAAVVAKVSGESLAETVKPPEVHEEFGEITMFVGLATMALAWLWWWLERRREKAPPGRSSLAAMVAGGLTVAAAVAVTVLTVLTGHSGAAATWTARTAPAPAPPAAAPAASGTPAASTASAAPDATPRATRTFTMADVAGHNGRASCWAVVDGHVYDLTSWIDSHPGGPQRILNLCGTDATEQFRAQHDDDRRPNNQLAQLRIGELS